MDASVNGRAVIGGNSGSIVGNWIALSRDTATHWLVGFGQPVKPASPERGAHSRGEAWIDLIMLARYKAGVEKNKGKRIPLEVGQLQGGYSFLALRWNWTLKQVRLFLEKLVQECMIEKSQPSARASDDEKPGLVSTKTTKKQGKQSGNQIQVITLCNYRKYQIASELMDLMEGQAKGKRGASEGQHLNKENKDNTTHTSAGATEEGLAPDYVFKGRALRLDQSQFDRWQQTFSTLNLRSELEAVDAFVAKASRDPFFPLSEADRELKALQYLTKRAREFVPAQPPKRKPATRPYAWG